ncbi:MAG: (Fe-S)-binding protein [Egibacteraceae bacterium]
MPAFARQTFREWFAARTAPKTVGERVILWPDTFNGHFSPRVLQAGVEVLEAAGFRVTIPGRPLCCGRPLYDYGFLDRAKRRLRQIMDVLQPDITAGVPIVGLEPSCIAAFRDELRNLFPHDEDARRLSTQTVLLSELLEQRAAAWTMPRLRRSAVVQGHCHHKSVLGFGDETRVLERIGLDATVLDSGCCGMAGSFRFETGHYDVSLAVGERVLLPAVREADERTLIVADGFSCREQITQSTDRKAVHLAEVIRMALQGDRA